LISRLSRRMVLALALLLLAYGSFVALFVRSVALQQEEETLQRLSHGLARHIVEHWPEVAAGDNGDAAAQRALLNMLMVVNPGIQVFMLDADGRVAAYIGDPDLVRTAQVDLGPVRAFLAGSALPLRGTDPTAVGVRRIFSVAMFPQRPGDARPPGYLYVVLEGPARTATAGAVSLRSTWQGVAWAASLGLLVTLVVGVLVVRRITLPLNRLAWRMQGFDIGGEPASQPTARPAAVLDEVQAIEHSFDHMTERIREQVRARDEQAAAHRDVMANVAHDLRTPLTAMHGHLEALKTAGGTMDAARRERHIDVALAQSDKVRRLSQQLFELATLQSTSDVLQRERIRLDEIVTDTVQKFELGSSPVRVALAGPAPGPIELDGDVHLIERALTNLIDNAVRHAPGEPVCVSLHCDGRQAMVLVEDRGPGLPAELAQRLDAGHSVREPPLHRPGGGVGGLGLAIAQRIAVLHGGSLRTLPAPDGGTRLGFALPRTPQPG
jgi:signal transduction histidine kinase